MIKILIIEKDTRVLNLLSVGLSSDFDATIISTFNSLEAKELIVDQKPDLIVVRNQFVVDGEVLNIASTVLNYLYDKSSDIPVIVLGELDFPAANVEKLPERFRIEELKRLVIKILNISADQLKHLKLPENVPLGIQNFYLMETAACDIYIKLKSKDEEKFIKRINKGDSIDKLAVQKYEENSVQFFYVKKADHLNLLNQLLHQSLEKVVKAAKSGQSLHEVNSDTYNISQNLIDAVGITDHTVRLTSVAISSMSKAIEGYGNISSLIKSILSDTGSYAYKRNFLSSALSREVAPFMEWGSGDQLNLQIEKMTYLSFFHDIFLKNETQLKIFSNEEARQLDLESSDLVLNHANLATNLIQSFPKTPSGVDILIKQHHGTNTGVGFAAHYTAGISPMAITFIVIERYAYYILEHTSLELEDAIVRDSIFLLLYREFHLPSYKKVVDILKKISIS